ncbi:MAG: EI24 domain-containing protein [Cetobacterium sp.]|nr:EI24 domain-containing protein [Cetobacterium sp.]
MNSLKYVFQGYLEAFQLIERAKLKKYYFLPGIISIGVFICFYFISTYISFSFYDFIGKILKLQEYTSLAKILVKILVGIIGFLMYFLLYKSITLIILSPFLSYISEKTECYYLNKEFTFSMKDNLRFILRGALLGFRSLIVEILGLIIALFLGFIPVVNIGTPLFLFLFQSYFTGASLVDYTLERRKLDYKDSYRFMGKHYVFTTLNGIFFTILLLIPVVGFFVAPLISTVGGTLSTIKLMENTKK